MKIFLIILLVLIVLIIILGFVLAAYSVNINRQSLEDARKWQEEHYDISWYDGLEKEDYIIKSYDGYELHAELLKNQKPSESYIIISHGYTDNRFGSLKYAKMYLDMGFNVIIYDLRGHGLNEATHCTYSIRESRDLDAVIKDTRARYPDAKILGIQGESLGSATSIAVLKYKPNIDFVVADCGFSEIKSVMRSGLVKMHLPGFLVNIASVCAKLRYGHFYKEMRPIDSLSDNVTPILFIHGEADDFILPAHSKAMSRATKGFNRLHIIPGATHAASILTAPDDYKRHVSEFFQAINTNPES